MADKILHPLKLQDLARAWLLEDTSNFNFANSVDSDELCSFAIFMKGSGVLAGIPFANAVFEQLNLTPRWLHKDGDWIEAVSEVCRITGPARKLLLAERVVLNVLCRVSGVASATFKMQQQLLDVSWKGTLACTRKTTPGFRMVEKYAVLIGGGDIHRYDLSSMIMLKDNHVSLCGSVSEAIKRVRKVSSFTLKIEVECRTLQDAMEACDAKCDIIMLDNFKPEDIKAAAEKIKARNPNILIEVSGGITKENIVSYADPLVDVISSSAIVQGYDTIDFSMKFMHQ